MGWLKDRIKNWLNIQPPVGMSINVIEPYGYEVNVFRNQLWYRGDPSELHQFYTSLDDLMGNTCFWSATSSTGINFRKIHSGLPALIVDVLVNIVVNDLNKITINNTEKQKRWDLIAKDNDFEDILKSAIRQALVEGDGSFKISADPEISEFPIIEFYAGPRVQYESKRDRVQAVNFITETLNDKTSQRFTLQERYSKEGIEYTLYNSQGNEIETTTLPEYADLVDLKNTNDFLMAVPLLFEKSPKFDNRGKSLFDSKTHSFDGLDECISQWIEALRDGRTTKYIPETLLPKNMSNGETLRPNSFDNRYISTKADLAEDAKNKIDVTSGEIPHEALVSAYVTLLDLCLQGLVSPSTLGIDVKKIDNADAQREKEKTTLYTRSKIIERLEKVIPLLVETVLKVDDMLNETTPGEYEVKIEFGEYANPSFEAQVETLSKAKVGGIMSVEKIVDELWGDTLDEDEKAKEVERLKSEQGVATAPQDDMSNELEGSNDDNSPNKPKLVPDGKAPVLKDGIAAGQSVNGENKLNLLPGKNGNLPNGKGAVSGQGKPNVGG